MSISFKTLVCGANGPIIFVGGDTDFKQDFITFCSVNRKVYDE
jgi:hypothetical protein